MDRRIVLGFPYSGAFYWLLSAEQHYNKPIKGKYDGQHPYYHTLFGKNHSSIIDETVSLTLLFEEIYMSPADTYLPDRAKYHIYDTFLEQDWGIYFNWEWIKDFQSYYNEADLLLKDKTIASTLRKVPKFAKSQIIRDAMIQIQISNQYEATIFASPSYLRLCQAINSILNPSEQLIIKNPHSTLAAVDTVFDIASLKFSINSLDEFVSLKAQKDVRQYAHSFKEYINELPNGTYDKDFLFNAMLEAINKDSISSKISGALELISSYAMALLLIDPSITLVNATRATSSFLSKMIKKKSKNYKWWLLAPEVSKVLTKHRIEMIAGKKSNS